MFIHAIHSEHRPVKNDRMTTVWPDDCLRRTHHSQHQKSLNLNILYINYIIIYIYCIIVNVTQLLNNRNVSRHWQYSHRVTQRRERSDNKNLAELCNIVLKMKKKILADCEMALFVHCQKDFTRFTKWRRVTQSFVHGKGLFGGSTQQDEKNCRRDTPSSAGRLQTKPFALWTDLHLTVCQIIGKCLPRRPNWSSRLFRSIWVTRYSR